MTRDEILALPAGRKLDVLMAEMVMGWPLRPYHDDENVFPCFNIFDTMDEILVWLGRKDSQGKWWSPSRDIAAAWPLVDHLGTTRNLLLVMNRIHPTGNYRAGFIELGRSPTRAMHESDPSVFAWEATAPLCIVRAALLAVLPQ